MTVAEMHAAAAPGDRVTIRTPQGQERTGRVVMRSPHGLTLNMGGAHGTPGSATPDNLVKIQQAKSDSALQRALKKANLY